MLYRDILEGFSLKKAVRKKRPEYITLKIIRGTTQDTRSIRLPKVLFNILIGFLASFLLFVGIMTYKAENLNCTYRDKLEDITKLEATNEAQQREIETLNRITAEVREKLQSLEDIEAKVKGLVGIDE